MSGSGRRSALAVSDPHILLLGGDGGRSGVPTYLSQMVQALQGHARLTVVTDVNRGGYDFLVGSGIRHIEVPGLRTSPHALRLWRAARMLQRVIAELSPDLVWAHARMAGHLLRLLPPGAAPTALAVTHHSLPFEPGQRAVVAALARRAEAVLMARAPAHHVIHLTQSAADRYADGLGAATLARHRVAVLGNCSTLGPLPDVPRRKSGRVIVMTARIGYQKNPLAAARILAHLPADFTMLLCGAGTERAAFQRDFLRLSGRGADISFLGPVADVRPVLAQADMFLMTSRYEGMPIAALEAFEAGLPLALPDIPGVSEIVAAHPLALTFDTADPRRAAQRIARLTHVWADAREANRAGIRAAWDGRFSFDVWRADLLALIAGMRGEGGDFRL